VIAPKQSILGFLSSVEKDALATARAAFFKSILFARILFLKILLTHAYRRTVPVAIGVEGVCSRIAAGVTPAG
jgi:hypothetical protein